MPLNDSHDSLAPLFAAVEHTKLSFALGQAVEPVLDQLCQEALEHGFAGVCVRPEHAAFVRQRLGASNVKLVGVAGFPEAPVSKGLQAETPTIGAVNSTTKFQEITTLQMDGADEVDLVLNVAFLKTDVETGYRFTQQELQAAVLAAGDLPLKLIIETDLLTEAEIVQAALWGAEAGMAWIKTSTGFVKEGVGATVPHVALIRQTLDAAGYSEVGVKASGGIATAAQAAALLAAGANRLGTSRALQWRQASSAAALENRY